MALDYAETSKKIIEAVGGASNIASATNCMTRLHLVLREESKADDKAVEGIKGVKSVIKQGGQYQVVIGNEVSSLFKEFKKLGNWGEDGSSAPQKPAGSPLQRMFGFISGCMTPLLPALLGCGMVKVVLTLLVNFAGLSTGSSTYIILNAMGDSVLYFLPVFLCYTSAKKMGGTPALWMVVGMAMIYPSLVTLMAGGSLELGAFTLGSFFSVPTTTFFGIPVICTTYTTSFLPIMLMAPVMKGVEEFADRVSPNLLKAFLKPLLFVLICVPVVLIVLGPIGNILGQLLSGVFVRMYDAIPWLTAGILAAVRPFIVMTGMHYALGPLCMNNLATLGFDPLVIVTAVCSNIAQGGAAMGVALRTKNTETKSEGIACGISSVLAGVTEPALYGINMRYVTPMIGVVAGAGVSGLFYGMTGVKCYTMGGAPSVLSLVTFIGGDEPMRGVIFGAIGVVISFVVSFAVAFLLFKDPAPVEERAESSAPAVPAITGKTVIASPIPGKVVPLESVPDETFAAGILGRGFAVEPEQGKVYAPFDGVCDTVFDTLHALNLVSSQGVELLIHVGLETVGLNGAPFKAHVHSGDPIKKGQLLLEFDMEKIRAGGCKTVTPVLVTNEDDLPGMTIEDGQIIIGG